MPVEFPYWTERPRSTQPCAVCDTKTRSHGLAFRAGKAAAICHGCYSRFDGDPEAVLAAAEEAEQ